MDMNAAGDWAWHSLVRLAEVAPLATLAAAAAAAIAIVQKSRSDRRQAWWDRLRWATDTALSENEKSKRVGIAAVKAVQRMPPLRAEDQQLLEAVGDEVLTEEVEGLEIIAFTDSPDVDESLKPEDNESDKGGD
ncbi:hypothetical protein LG293_17130 (plasmid) [Citricoccus nitrophenolicus]